MVVPPTADEPFVAGGGIAGELVRSTDWSKTPVGPIAGWPTCLKIHVATVLRSRHPMFLWWGEHLTQFYNDAYLPSLGPRHPAAMGQAGQECWPEIWPIIGPQIDDVMSRDMSTWNEDALIPIFRKGRLEDVYWTYGYSPVLDDEGRIAGTLVVVTETTARVVAERALTEMSESLATTLDSIGEGVIATDLSGAVVRMNRVAETLTGWNLSEAEGKSVTDLLSFVNEDTRAAVATPIHETLRHGVTVSLPNRTVLVRRDGSEIPIGDSCAPIKSSDGTVHGAVLVFRDLTAARTAEATQENFRRQLIFADRMASVGTLAAGVAHEINNPLMYVAANVDTAIEAVRALAGGSASAPMRNIAEMLIEAREGAGRITKIVRGLKTFSRVEQERTSVTDLVSVLELSANMAFNEVRHRARLVEDYGKVPLVDADDARLGQVFINLLVNAAQAMPAGDAEAQEIRIVTSTDADGRAVVEVSDTGPGITPSILPRVFDPFFTTKPVGVGTGLGLSICHTIVTGMGGQISARSELGRGTTFRIVLPASRSGPRAAFVRAASLADAPAQRVASVLVVDDEPSVGLAVRRILRGHEVTVVTSAWEAMDIVASGKDFDVVLSDLMMPGMSGMEFHAALSREHPTMASRVVFMSGGAFTPEANSFLDRVANKRLEKPIDIEQLRELVRESVE